jgi:hypothetical protein
MPAWWGTKHDVSRRLHVEFTAMRTRFGKTFELVKPEWGLLYWLGTVQVNMAGVTPRDHTLKILYPAEYPNKAAEVYIVQPRIYSEKHQFEDGQLCLFNPKDGTDYGWNPAHSTAVTAALWGIEWLYAYYTWRKTGDWPGLEERVHWRRE